MSNSQTSQTSPSTVLWWFIKRATAGGVRNLGRVRLVKLLYLLEVEYFRLHQRRLTDLTWKFYYYGPYPMQFEGLVEQAGLESQDTPISGGRILRVLSLPEFDSRQPPLPDEVATLVDRIVKDWADASLNRLLNFVYFETEPMLRARRGDVLDFSSIRPRSEYRLVPKPIDRKKLVAIRDSLAQRLVKAAATGSPRNVDPTIRECLAPWDEDEAEASIKGEALLVPDPSEREDEDEPS